MPSGKTLVLTIVASLALIVGDACAKTGQPATTRVEELPTLSAQPGGAVPAKVAEGNAQTIEPNAATQPAKPRNSMDYLPFLLLGLLLVFFLWSSKSKKKQEQKHQQMLAGLKKGDKVTSIGGIVGTIIEVRDDEVVVKVDETNNVRMRFARWAIRGVGEEARKQGLDEKK